MVEENRKKSKAAQYIFDALREPLMDLDRSLTEASVVYFGSQSAPLKLSYEPLLDPLSNHTAALLDAYLFSRSPGSGLKKLIAQRAEMFSARA